MVVLEQLPQKSPENITSSSASHAAVAAMASGLPTYLNSPYLQPLEVNYKYF